MNKTWLWIVIFALPLTMVLWKPSNDKETALSSYAMLPKGSTLLFSTSWCGYCKKTRHLFNKHNIPYIEYDIEKSPTARKQYDELNGRGVPLVVANDTLIRGYNPQAIIRELNKQAKALNENH